MIDTHAHLNFCDYDSDRDEIIKDSLNKGILIVNVGTNFLSSQKAAEIAQSYEKGVFAAIGLHPENIDYGLDEKRKKGDKPEDVAEFDFNAQIYAKLAENKKVAAVGEIGLDFFGLPKSAGKRQAIKVKQTEIFLKQLDFARAQKLPVIIHCRAAHNEMIELLKKDFALKGAVSGVIHCFTANKQQAAEYYNLGFYFGVTGIIFKMDLAEALLAISLDRILLETDCPFLAPPETDQRNIPQNLPQIAEKLAQIRGESVEAVVAAADANSKKLFGLN